MALSPALQQALLTTGASILAGNTGRQSGQAAIGQGLLAGLGSYQQGLAQQKAEERELAQQDALQQAMGNLPPELQQLAVANPELAANLLARRSMAEFEQGLAAKAPITPLQQEKLALEQERVNQGAANVDIARQKLAQDNQFKAQGLQLQAASLAQKMESEGKLSPSDTAGMRKEFVAGSKDYIKVRDAFKKIESSAKSTSGASDMSLIFNYMKMLDPQSTVREGEFATAANTGGLSDSIVNMYNKARSGNFLTSKQKQDFLNEAGSIMQGQEQSHIQLRDEYTRLATDFGVDPGKIVVDYLPKRDKKATKEAIETGQISTKDLQGMSDDDLAKLWQ
jgi:hypothetical protein